MTFYCVNKKHRKNKNNNITLVIVPAVFFIGVILFSPISYSDTHCDKTINTALFPAELPPLGEDVCATTGNIAKDDIFVRQRFAVDGMAIKDFVANYSKKLIDHGWTVTEEKKGTYKEMPTASYHQLTATHKGGYKLVLGCTDVFRKGLRKKQPAPDAKTKEGFDIDLQILRQ